MEKLIKGRLYTYGHANEAYIFYFIFDKMADNMVIAKDGYVQNSKFNSMTNMYSGTGNLKESTKEEIEIYNKYAIVKYKERRRIYEIY